MRNVLLLLAAAAVCGQEDPWSQVRQLAAGSELRIYRTGARRPVDARFDQLTRHALVVLQKDTVTAIPKDEIERIDARAGDSGGRVAAETHRTIGSPEEASLGRIKGSSLPPRSVSGGVKIQPKPGFTTVYRRRAETGK